MNEVAALLAAFLEATGREAAIWERREGGVTFTLLGASSPAFVVRTEPGAQAWDVATWARTQALQAQLVTTGDSVGWLFVESGHAPDADRLLGRLLPVIRRLTRDIKERGRTIDSVIDQYMNVVRPGHFQFIEPTKQYADIIIPEGGANESALHVLVSFINTILGETKKG
jgi:hypothetical protein